MWGCMYMPICAHKHRFYTHRMQWTVHCKKHWLRVEGFCLIFFTLSLLYEYGGEIHLLFVYYCKHSRFPLLAVRSPQLLFAWMHYCHPDFCLQKSPASTWLKTWAGNSPCPLVACISFKKKKNKNQAHRPKHSTVRMMCRLWAINNGIT